MKDKALEYFRSGFSCSESVLKAAIDKNLINEHLLPVGTVFSGGISSGCLCGAIAACEIIIGATKGRCSLEQSPAEAKTLAAEFISQFKSKYGATCCRVLTAKYDFASKDRKEHCAEMVNAATQILEKLLEIKTPEKV